MQINIQLIIKYENIINQSELKVLTYTNVVQNQNDQILIIDYFPR